jgi:phage tail-like protein
MGLIQTTSTVGALNPGTLNPLTDIEEYPIPSYQFSIEIESKSMAIFQSVTGIAVSREVIPYKQGGENSFAFEFPGHITYAHIICKTGLTSSDFFWKWMMVGQLEGSALKKNFNLIQRRPDPHPSTGNPMYKIVKNWSFINAFPVKWVMSDLNLATATTIVMESLEFSFDYFEPGPI